MADYRAKMELEIEAKGLDRLSSLRRDIDSLAAKVKAAKIGGDPAEIAKAETALRAVRFEYSRLQKTIIDTAHGQRELTQGTKAFAAEIGKQTAAANQASGALQKMGASAASQVRSLALQYVGIQGVINATKELYKRSMELDGEYGKLHQSTAKARGEFEKFLNNVARNTKPTFDAAAKGIAALSVGMGELYIKANQITAAGFGFLLGGGSGAASAWRSTGREMGMGVKMPFQSSFNQKSHDAGIKAEMAAAAEENERLNKEAEQYLKDQAQAERDSIERARNRAEIEKERTAELKEQKRLLDDMNEKAARIERESMRGDLGSGGWGANGGITDFSPAGLAAARARASAETLVKAGEAVAKSNQNTAKTEQEIAEEREKQAAFALQTFQAVTGAFDAFMSGDIGKGAGGLATFIGSQAGLTGSEAALLGMGVGQVGGAIGGLAAGGEARNQAYGSIAGAGLGAVVAGPMGASIGAEVGKTVAKVFGGKGAHVRIMNPQEIGAEIHRAVFGDRTSLMGGSVSKGFAEQYAGKSMTDAEFRDWMAGKNQQAGAAGMTGGGMVELLTMIQTGAMASGVQSRYAAGTQTDADWAYQDSHGWENLQAEIQLGTEALDKFNAELEKQIENYNAGVSAMADFEKKVDRQIADLTGQTDAFIENERGLAQARLEGAQTWEEAIQAGNDLLDIQTEQYQRALEDSKAFFQAQRDEVEKQTKEMLATLEGEFKWFSGILGELISVQGEKAALISAQEDRRFQMSRQRYAISNQYEEKNAAEMYGSLMGEFGKMKGGADLTNERDVTRLMSVLDEARGTVGAARSQSLIGGDEALRRMDELEKFYTEIENARIGAAGTREAKLSSSLVDSTFGQDMGLTMGEGGIMMGGEQVGATELQTRAQTFYAKRQSDILESQQLKLDAINEQAQRAIDFLTAWDVSRREDIRNDVRDGVGKLLTEKKAEILALADAVARALNASPEDVKAFWGNIAGIFNAANSVNFQGKL